MSRILGIDPGLASCGFAIVSTANRKPHCLASGSWETEPHPDWRDRIQCLTELAAGEMRGVDLVAIEAYTYQGDRSYAANMLRIPRLIQRLCDMAESRHIPYIEVTTTQCKAALGLKGKCDKARVRQAIQVLVDGTWPTTTHARDAVAAAIAGERAWRMQTVGKVAV